jgi:hypothetical protein
MRWIGFAFGVLLILAACSQQGEPVSVTTPSEHVTAPTDPSTEQPSATPAEQRANNDLKKGQLKRSFTAGDVKITADYSLRNLVQHWSPGVAQPLTMWLRANEIGQPATDRKIYLSRVTAYLEVSDASGHLDSPDPLLDRADISPGFLVLDPSYYTQVFVLPPLPDEATELTIDFHYEILISQPDSSRRDFAKRTATDTVVISRS